MALAAGTHKSTNVLLGSEALGANTVATPQLKLQQLINRALLNCLNPSADHFGARSSAIGWGALPA
jgi:hypothetical protein